MQPVAAAAATAAAISAADVGDDGMTQSPPVAADREEHQATAGDTGARDEPHPPHICGDYSAAALTQVLVQKVLVSRQTLITSLHRQTSVVL